MSYKILVLCYGNINRSPACEAVLRLIGMDVTSAGFREKNNGMRASKKTRDAMTVRGYDLEHHRAREAVRKDFETADTILCMGQGNFKRLPRNVKLGTKVQMLGEYCDPPLKNIPDPAWLKKGSPAFERVIDLIVEGSLAFGRSHGYEG